MTDAQDALERQYVEAITTESFDNAVWKYRSLKQMLAPKIMYVWKH